MLLLSSPDTQRQANEPADDVEPNHQRLTEFNERNRISDKMGVSVSESPLNNHDVDCVKGLMVFVWVPRYSNGPIKQLEFANQYAGF